MGASCSAWRLSLLVWLAPLQIVIGDLHGLNTLEYQPAKVAALEAHWDTGSSVPLILFAHPRPEGRDQPLRARDPGARQPDPHP